MATATKKKGGRPKQFEHHRSYSYTTKSGRVVKVKAHKEKKN